MSLHWASCVRSTLPYWQPRWQLRFRPNLSPHSCIGLHVLNPADHISRLSIMCITSVPDVLPFFKSRFVRFTALAPRYNLYLATTLRRHTSIFGQNSSALHVTDFSTAVAHTSATLVGSATFLYIKRKCYCSRFSYRFCANDFQSWPFRGFINFCSSNLEVTVYGRWSPLALLKINVSLFPPT